MSEILKSLAVAAAVLTAAQWVEAGPDRDAKTHPDHKKHEEKKSEARGERGHEEHQRSHERRESEEKWLLEKQLLTTDGRGNWVVVGTYNTRAEAEAAAEPLRATENVRIVRADSGDDFVEHEENMGHCHRNPTPTGDGTTIDPGFNLRPGTTIDPGYSRQPGGGTTIDPGYSRQPG
jgi:hypothetical protein